MDLRADFTLIHGWGLGSFFFAQWQKTLPQAKLWNRGYFGVSAQPAPTPGSWLVTHSLGLHWIKPELFSELAGVIILGGFANFDLCKSQVKAMVKKLKLNPQGLLQDFYTTTFAPTPCPFTPPQVVDFDLLQQDLMSLLNLNLDLAALSQCPKIKLFQGQEDIINPLAQAKALADQLPQASFTLLPSQGHGFAYFDPDFILKGGN